MKWHRQAWLCGLMLTAGLFVLFGLTAAHAAPEAPMLGGTFTVNSNADSNSSDTVLTLREALLLARGGTGANGLNRALSTGEKAQTGGCTINGSNLITGGCGAGVTNTISFALVAATISLGSPLPPVDNTAPTIVDGYGFVRPSINASGLAAGQNGLTIVSDNNTLKALAVSGSPHHNIVISGTRNIVQNVFVTSATLDGIDLAGDYNTVDGDSVGISADTGGCFANGGFGIRIEAGSLGNTVSNSTVSCNGYIGIAIMSYSGAGNHQIGPNNRIGTDPQGVAARPNGTDGVAVSSNTNDIFSNTIGFNGLNGVDVYGDWNSVRGNTVLTNTRSGVRLYGPAQNNYVGCVRLCLGLSGNAIRAIANGIELTGTLVTNNIVEANVVSGTNAIGVRLDGAHNNYIGAAGAGGNTLTGLEHAVVLDHGAYANQIAGNTIGSFTTPNASGIQLIHDAHDNVIGGPAPAQGNDIVHNHDDGIYISGYFAGGNTAGNIISNNLIDHNWGNGIRIAHAAHDTLVGGYGLTNTITFNGLDGIAIDNNAYSNTVGYNQIGISDGAEAANQGNGITLDSGAHDNRIGTPLAGAGAPLAISYNAGNGVLISGTATTANWFFRSTVTSNGVNGLLITAGAHDNVIGDAINAGNNIWYNDGHGIMLSAGAHDNAIGHDNVSSNHGHGVYMAGAGTSGNVISDTFAGLNILDGIAQGSGAAQNSWTHATTFRNQGLGIDLDAPANARGTPTGPFPVITRVASSGGNVTVYGTATQPVFAVTTVMVEVYAVDLDASGYGEGKIYVGHGAPLMDGTWSVTFPSAAAGCYTAFQTLIPWSGVGYSSSSEFGPNSCRVMLPLIRR